MTYYELNRPRQLRLASEYRERNRGEINKKQRERYWTKTEYRDYQIQYQKEYRGKYGALCQEN